MFQLQKGYNLGEKKWALGFTLTLLIFLIKEKDYSRYDYPVAQFA